MLPRGFLASSQALKTGKLRNLVIFCQRSQDQIKNTGASGLYKGFLNPS